MPTETPDIQGIFSVPIYKVKLDLDIKKLLSFCSTYRQTNFHFRTDVGGYHSSNLNSNDVTLQPLVKEILIHSSKFAQTFLSKNNQLLNNMWFNVNRYKDSNKSHNHPGDDISGVYYIQTPDKCGNIIFENPAQEYLDYYLLNVENPPDTNFYSSRTWWMPVEINTLYVFPSWLKHSVDVNRNETEERISIAFNTYHERLQNPKNTSSWSKKNFFQTG